jgi:fused signal recognition particle receptor
MGLLVRLSLIQLKFDGKSALSHQNGSAFLFFLLDLRTNSGQVDILPLPRFNVARNVGASGGHYARIDGRLARKPRTGAGRETTKKMSTTVIVAIAVAVVVFVAVIIAFSRRKGAAELPPAEKPPHGPSATSGPERYGSRRVFAEAPAGSTKTTDSRVAEGQEGVDRSASSSATREREAGPLPSVPPPLEPGPGVRLDESAEAEAQAKLNEARRERKLQKLRQGLAATRGGLVGKITELFKGKKEIDPALLDELEETLITSDVGTKTTQWLIEMLRGALDRNELKDPEAIWALLRSEVKHALNLSAELPDVSKGKPHVIMVIGVNGVGKTTTIGKLATKYVEQGHKVVLAAGDTFRAAAVNQLEIWGRRAGCEIVKASEGTDPSSVIFEAVKQAKESGADIVIADTAGRLHTKAPLMDELKKIKRVMGKVHESAPHEVLLVLDATTGQNAMQQVSMFAEALSVSGLVLTKLDGTAKGGVIIGICHEHKIPVRYIGIGEAKDDLREFYVDDFVDALFHRDESEQKVA